MSGEQQKGTTVKLLVDEFFVWVDIETTGLDPYDDEILEAGFKVTDLDLNILHENVVRVWSTGLESFWESEDVSAWAKHMHEHNGLIDDCRTDGMLKGVADTLFTESLQRILDGIGFAFKDENNQLAKPPMCGSSVHFDRGFLAVHFPTFAKMFSYRNADVSAVKEFMKRNNPELAAKLPEKTQEMHRALPDIDDTITEYKFYAENYLYTTRGV